MRDDTEVILRLLACAVLVALVLSGCALPGDEATATALPVATNVPSPKFVVPDTPTATVTAVPGVGPGATAIRTAAPPAPTPTNPPPTVAPTRPPVPTATATPAAPRLTKLTDDGCCAGPQWTADGSAVFYYGYSGAGGWQAGALGTWVVPRGGGAARPFSPVYGTFSASRRLVAFREGATATVAWVDGTPLGQLQTGAALLFLAPTDDRIAWLAPDPGIPQVSSSLEPPARVRVATIGPDGVGAARTLDPIVRAETLHWLPDGRHIALSTRDERGLNGGIVVLDTETGATRRVAEGNFLENLTVSPDASGLVYTAVLQPTAADNGVWYVRLDGTGRRKLPIAGGYRWTPDGRGLLHIPAPSDLPTDELRLHSLADGTTRTLVTAQQAPFLVASNDWEVAPDGRALVFRSATDGAIWALEFGP